MEVLSTQAEFVESGQYIFIYRSMYGLDGHILCSPIDVSNDSIAESQ